MKRLFILSVLPLFFSACATQMVTKSPAEVKIMTTKQLEANKDLVFKSIISLLQSESYLINQTDRETGIINASKRLQNRNAAFQRAMIGTAKEANTSKAMFYVEEINANLSEVKITLYEGAETATNGYWGTVNKENKEQMLYDATVYQGWFNNLNAEIERRKALLN